MSNSCFNSRCYGNFVGPARDQAFNSLNVERIFATCLRAATGAVNGCGNVPTNLNLFMAPSTASPPGNDNNDGSSFTSPVLTFNRVYEIIRAIGFESQAIVHMESGVYPIGTGSGSADSGCINAGTGSLGTQCQGVVFEGAAMNTVHAAVTVSNVQVTQTTINGVAATSPSTLVQATLNVAAVTLRVGDIVNFSSGFRAQISGLQPASAPGTTNIVFPISNASHPTVVAAGAASVQRIDAASGSTIAVTDTVDWTFNGSSAKTWLRNIRVEMYQSSPGVNQSNLYFIGPQVLCANNVVAVDADTTNPGNKLVAVLSSVIFITGFSVFADAISRQGAAEDTAGLTLDGSNGGLTPTGLITFSDDLADATLANFNTVRSNLSGERLGISGHVSYQDNPYALTNSVYWKVRYAEYYDTLVPSNASFTVVDDSNLNLADVNFTNSGTPGLRNSALVTGASSTTMNNVNICNVVPRTAGQSYTYGMFLTASSIAECQQITIDGCSSDGFTVADASCAYFGFNSNAVVSLISSTNGTNGVLVKDGGTLSSEFGISAYGNSNSGILVTSGSTLVINPIQVPPPSSRIDSNAVDGITVAQNSRAVLDFVTAPAVPNTLRGINVETGSSVSAAFNTTVSNPPLGTAGQLKVGSMAAGTWAGATYLFTSANRNVNDFNPPGVAAVGTVQGCLVTTF
jgi:hypothetical protein